MSKLLYHGPQRKEDQARGMCRIDNESHALSASIKIGMFEEWNETVDVEEGC